MPRLMSKNLPDRDGCSYRRAPSGASRHPRPGPGLPLGRGRRIPLGSIRWYCPGAASGSRVRCYVSPQEEQRGCHRGSLVRKSYLSNRYRATGARGPERGERFVRTRTSSREFSTCAEGDAMCPGLTHVCRLPAGQVFEYTHPPIPMAQARGADSAISILNPERGGGVADSEGP